MVGTTAMFRTATTHASTNRSFQAGTTSSVAESSWEGYYKQHDEAHVLWNNKDADADLVAEVKALRDPLTHLHALDIGCGLGYDTLYMLTHGFYQVTCLDASPSALTAAKARVRDAFSEIGSMNTINHAEFVHAYLGANSARPLGAAPRYHLVWVRSVLQHLSDVDALGMLTYVRSLLHPGGMLLLKEYESCPDEAVGTSIDDCGQSRGPKNTRPPAVLLKLLKRIFPHCTASKTGGQTVCGSPFCAQLLHCPNAGPLSPLSLPPPPTRSLPPPPSPRPPHAVASVAAWHEHAAHAAKSIGGSSGNGADPEAVLRSIASVLAPLLVAAVLISIFLWRRRRRAFPAREEWRPVQTDDAEAMAAAADERTTASILASFRAAL